MKFPIRLRASIVGSAHLMALLLTVSSGTLLLAQANAKGQETADHEFFEKKVRPILATKCQMCHNAKMKSSGLDMSSGEAFFKGGASGSLVNVESPEKSFLIQAVGYEGSLKMPPSGKLPDEQIATLKEWIQRGAKWPGAEMKVVSDAKEAAPTGSGTRKQGKAANPRRACLLGLFARQAASRASVPGQ